MGRNCHDFWFPDAHKPCSLEKLCVPNAPKICPYYNMCDIKIKEPNTAPNVDYRLITKLIF